MAKIYLKKVKELEKEHCFGCFFENNQYECLVKKIKFSKICKEEKIIFIQVPPIKSIHDLPKPPKIVKKHKKT